MVANALGSPLGALVERFGARRAVGLVGAHDPAIDLPVEPPRPEFRSALSFLGTYGSDRADALEHLFFEPARLLPDRRFVLAGGGFAQGRLAPGITYFPVVTPLDQAEFFSAAECALVIARRAALGDGASATARLFQAAGAGARVLTDPFPGLESLFRVGEEVLLARDSGDVLAALDLSPEERRAIGLRARHRALREHTYARRAIELVQRLDEISGGRRPPR